MNTFASIATVVSGFAAVIALLLVWAQLRYQGRQLRQSALMDLHKDLIRPDTQRAIRFIYSRPPKDLERPESQDVLNQIELVLNQYDLLGIRMQCGAIPCSEALATEWQVTLRLWHQLAGFCRSESSRRGGAPYKAGFEWLVEKSREYQRQHHPEVTIKPFARTFELPQKATNAATPTLGENVALETATQ